MATRGEDDAKRYAELAGFEGDWRDTWWNRDFLELAARRWGLECTRQALDVGCGAGHWTRTVLSMLPDDATITGVDREEAFCRTANEQARRRGLSDRLRCVEGTLETLPFDDDTFDLVTCQTVLIHVADPKRALSEMKRVTRPGGVVLAAEPDNLAGNLALLCSEPRLPDEDVVAIVRLLQGYQRGKQALGEGDDAIGGRLPGLMRQVGLDEVDVHVNDRCLDLAPPYDKPGSRLVLEQERTWAAGDVSMLIGARDDVARRVAAGLRDSGEARGIFEDGWAAVRSFARLVEEGVQAGTYHAARGFVLYLAGGRKPVPR